MTNGTVAMKSPASELEMRSSAQVRAHQVNVISTRANAMTHFQCPASRPSCRVAMAMGSRMAAPIASRPKTTMGVDSDVTPTLMSRYGSPQISPSDAKRIQPRRDTSRKASAPPR